MSYNIPENLLYTTDHEWAKIEDDIATVGVTDFAQSNMGDIVFIELPEVGANLDKGASFGVFESVKSVSDLYAPLSGEVIEVNEELEGAPEGCNEDPYAAWIMKIKLSNLGEIEELIKPEQYTKHCEEAE